MVSKVKIMSITTSLTSSCGGCEYRHGRREKGKWEDRCLRAHTVWRKMKVIKDDDVIPDWCPLDDYEEISDE